MKTKQLKRYFLSIAMIAILLLLAGNAFAATNASRDLVDGTNSHKGIYANNYMVASPYWQVDGGSYTFIAVSHSSLSGMASQIGLTINAITSAGAAYDTAETFTISSGATQRVFIIPTNHATINSNTVESAKFLSGTSGFTYGHIRVNPVAKEPWIKFEGRGVFEHGYGEGFRDSTMLTYWGSVIVEANTTGFAMEFLGDLNDSQTPHVLFSTGYMSSGINLQ